MTQPDTLDSMSVKQEEIASEVQPSQEEPRTLEDLSLAEVMGRFIQSPLRTWTGLSQTLSRPSDAMVVGKPRSVVIEKKKASVVNWRELAPLILMATAFLFAL